MGYFNNLCNLFGGEIMMIIVLGVIAYLIYDIYRVRNKNTMQFAKVSNQRTPVEHLEYQFATGQISEDEFVRKMNILKERQ